MPLQATSGAASYDAFGGGVPAAPPTYIEDVFSTFLYTGTGASRTIVNGIDLATKGGLIWIKDRTTVTNHCLVDTVQGITKNLVSNTTAAAATVASGDDITSFTTTGWTFGNNNLNINNSGDAFASWTFREQAKFFDIVTYTGNGSTQNIAHNLGSVPACIITKRTDSTNNWFVYHRSLGNDKYLMLNSTSAQTNDATIWNSTNPTSTQFSLGATTANSSGGTYVAYLFAHDAGGFGLTGTDNVISCGSYTGNGSTSGPTVTLGYEPQWVMIKTATAATYNNWFMFDTMRGISYGSGDAYLYANLTNAETTGGEFLDLTATGFNLTKENVCNESGVTYIYIAIRRGPMKVPTTGSSVFAPVTGSFSSPYTVTTNFPVDLTISGRTAGATMTVNDRLRGGTTNSYAYLNTRSTDAELTGTGAGLGFQSNTAVIDTNWQTGGDAIWWNFRRSPSFFDEVCYTGTGVARTVEHNLAAVPELMIVKSRSNADFWRAYSSATGNTKILIPNTDDASLTSTSTWNSTTPTSSVFTLGTDGQANGSGKTFVAYLFATCAGVSKVGSYTGTATTKQIDCGFTAGARFVLIKRTDSTGDWYVWDTARGIVSGNDPYILLNNSPQVTNTDYIDTYSAGFEISSTAPAAINASGGTFIFLAIA